MINVMQHVHGFYVLLLSVLPSRMGCGLSYSSAVELCSVCYGSLLFSLVSFANLNESLISNDERSGDLVVQSIALIEQLLLLNKS